MSKLNFEYNDVETPIFLVPAEKSEGYPYEPISTAKKKAKNSSGCYPILHPQRIMKNIRQISSCIHNNAAIDSDDVLWVWGAKEQAYQVEPPCINEFGNDVSDGRLMYSNDFSQNVNYIPQKMADDVLKVAAGAWHTLYITKENELWGWGNNECGQLGLGDTHFRSEPVRIMKNVLRAYANEYQSFAVKEDGTLWGWGSNEYGTLLLPDEMVLTPTLLMESVSQASCCEDYIAVVKENAELWIWGTNQNHLIFTKQQYQDQPPTLLMTGIKQVSLSMSVNADFGLAVTTKDELFVFGGQKQGCYVNKIIRKQADSDPIKVMHDIVATTAGNDIIFSIDKFGRLFSLGANEVAQGGIGTSTAAIRKPALVMNHVTQVAAGHFHGVALQDNGDVWIWGGDYGMHEYS